MRYSPGGLPCPDGHAFKATDVSSARCITATCSTLEMQDTPAWGVVTSITQHMPACQLSQALFPSSSHCFDIVLRVPMLLLSCLLMPDAHALCPCFSSSQNVSKMPELLGKLEAALDESLVW